MGYFRYENSICIMNETSNPTPDAGNQGTPNPSAVSSSGPYICQTVHRAIHQGAEKAKVAAEKVVPKVKAAVSDATYWLGFGLSYAAVFSYTLARELAPEQLKAGSRDGAEAGKKTAEGFAHRRESGSTQTGAASPLASPGPVV